jgi:GTP-binding protein Era
MAAGHRSGFVGIIGRPNVGKSTILNWYLGEPLSIVSAKPQTTRRRLLGVFTRDDAQVLFLDTPGLHEPQHALGRYMTEAAKAAIDEADVVVVVIDARQGITAQDEQVFAAVRRALRREGGAGQGPRTALLAINKVDLVKKPRLLPILEACAKLKLFAECIPVSALAGDQMEVLLERVISSLPEGPCWYEPAQRTDQPVAERVGELVREQILAATRQEVPHAVAVLVEAIEQRERVTAVQATLFVERPGHKAILIGRGGAMLKRIGQAARQPIERFIGRKVHLELWVKVEPDWRNNERVLRQLGYSGSGGA